MPKLPAFLAFLPALACAYPVSMDIGTFTIDNYSGNGGGGADMSFQIAGGQNFYWAASLNVPGYSSGAGVNNPSIALDFRNPQVTKAALTSTSSSFGNREYNDFVYYGGHGLSGGFFLGFNSDYGNVPASAMNLGVGYNRWMLANGCSLFKNGTPATVWQPAFKGLKALLSFKSVIFDNNLSWDLYNEFWTNWTYREKSLLNSFFDAQVSYGYKHLYPTKGLEPGCLSAQVAADRIDHCRESFKFVAHDYNKGTANTGYYYSKVIGTPQY